MAGIDKLRTANMKIVHIIEKYIHKDLNKYIALCLVMVDGKYKYQRIFFPDADAWRNLREGDYLEEE